MKFKYTLPASLAAQVANMDEFANGATQISAQLKDGRVFLAVLVSDSTYLIAARGYDDLPFSVEEIDRVFQSCDDKNPARRGGWNYWDKWE